MAGLPLVGLELGGEAWRVPRATGTPTVSVTQLGGAAGGHGSAARAGAAAAERGRGDERRRGPREEGNGSRGQVRT